MPLYEIRHTTPLTPTQCDRLASSLTNLHSTKFSTPKFFVNVVFFFSDQDSISASDSTSSSSSTRTYVGGKQLQENNYIVANVRSGPSRTQKEWDGLCEEVVEIWEGIVCHDGKDGNDEKKGDDGKGLRAVFVMGGLIAGWEAGFVIPKAGEDGEWLKKNLGEFERRARLGEGMFGDLVEEIGERGLL
ncbi:hypothetical protein SMMN14_06876, partial [Sphaerulina musiva]